LRHLLPISAPIQVKYEYEFRTSPSGKIGPVYLLVGFLDDGKGSYAACMGAADLRFRDKDRGKEDRSSGNGRFMVQHKVPVAMVVVQDGEGILTSTMNGEEGATLKGCELEAGSLLLWFHTDLSIGLRSIEIEGGLSPEAWDELRAGWIGRELDQRGF